MSLRPFLALAVALVCGPALAQNALAQEKSGCDAFKWSIARERSAFATPGLAQIDPGKPLPGVMDPAIVKLQPVAAVVFVMPPGHKPHDGTFGTVVKTPPLAVGGAYQITLSDEAWIDVIQDGHEVRSSAFAGAKDCPSVRKSVRFPFGPGDATIQISGAAADSIKLDLLPVE